MPPERDSMRFVSPTPLDSEPTCCGPSHVRASRGWLSTSRPQQNEACALALSGKPEQALKSLQEAFRAGYTDVAGMRGDDDLEAVRQLPAFDEWLKQLEKSP
jgi:hypothetical protein